MKGQPPSYSYRLIALSLLMVLLMSSCQELGLLQDPPAAEEVPTPGGFDPGMELSTQYLICPTIPQTIPPIPPGPYDEDLGDCALRGKTAEIEAWLTALEEIAAGCQANREAYWADTLAARDRLDEKIDEFVVYELAPIELEQPEEDEDEHERLLVEQEPTIAVSSCQGYERETFDDPTGEASPEQSHIFTASLIQINKYVAEYCTMIDELIKPLWFGCDEINYFQDCQDPDLDKYHEIIDQRMIEAQSNYDYTALFYLETLQQDGWDEFRAGFAETSIVCPLEPAVGSRPTFEFSMNTFCRRGPSSEYEKVATFLIGQEIKIRGSNLGEPRWWYVAIPGSSEHCWISEATGSAKGYLEDIEFVPAPALIQEETCTADLEQSACEAAGGTWAGKDTPTPYCDCK